MIQESSDIHWLVGFAGFELGANLEFFMFEEGHWCHIYIDIYTFMSRNALTFRRTAGPIELQM